jgi:hypothetical protein
LVVQPLLPDSLVHSRLLLASLAVEEVCSLRGWRLCLRILTSTQVHRLAFLVAFLPLDSLLTQPSLLRALTLAVLRLLASSHHHGDEVKMKMAAAKPISLSVRTEE